MDKVPGNRSSSVLSTISSIGSGVGRTLILVRSTHIHYNEGDCMDETPSRGGIDLDTADLITIAGVSLGILVITGFLVGLLF